LNICKDCWQVEVSHEGDVCEDCEVFYCHDCGEPLSAGEEHTCWLCIEKAEQFDKEDSE